MAKRELLASIRDRYRESSRKDKSKILDEFIAVTGHHRKHGIRLLGQFDDGVNKVGAVSVLLSSDSVPLNEKRKCPHG